LAPCPQSATWSAARMAVGWFDRRSGAHARIGSAQTGCWSGASRVRAAGGHRWRCRSCHAVVLCSARDDPVPVCSWRCGCEGAPRLTDTRAELRY
jgi:hypothetical protein